MNLFFWLALVSYASAFLIIIIFSIAYLSRSDFMPYHSIAVARPWSEVEPRMQVLLLALIKVTGWAWLAVATAGFLLLYLLLWKNGGLEQLIVFQLYCLIAVTPPIAVAFYVRQKTQAPTPVRSGTLVVILTLLGFTFALLSAQYT
ncbi:hypothetical protein J3D47_005240 [Pseudomonas laurylsulfativorans]|uniref:hypothetical protein n=1 Tax=Pseudomonas laurylsulfativorans TaxID=1943631 RepID=UPI00209E6F61|nr:hypothetical protein [Pseudomonas laurylsulfativorans]MCP1420997.1 hypothetical protein [Pseudomonas laurylsulfativorans]